MKINRRGCIGLGVVAIMFCGICSVCSTAIALVNRQPVTAYEAQVCVGVVTIGRTQIGLWWQIIFMSRMLPAALSPYARCVYMPWSSSLPPVGEIAFPP